MKALDIAIPVYEFNGLGVDVLQFNFERLRFQTFKNFSVVVSDNSQDNKIRLLCERFSDLLDIHYFKNSKCGAATNSNNAILKCEASLIKFLCADDYLFDNHSLQIIYDGFEDKKVNWLFTEYVHTNDRLNYYRHYIPQPLPNIFTNLLGTPSAMAMRNPRLLPAIELFDENLKYSYDLEAYWNWTKILGKPKIINNVCLANYVWDGSVTSTIDQNLINKENNYLLRKHGLTI